MRVRRNFLGPFWEFPREGDAQVWSPAPQVWSPAPQVWSPAPKVWSPVPQVWSPAPSSLPSSHGPPAYQNQQKHEKTRCFHTKIAFFLTPDCVLDYLWDPFGPLFRISDVFLRVFVEPSPESVEPSPTSLEPSPSSLEPSPSSLEPSPESVEPSPTSLEPSPAIASSLYFRICRRQPRYLSQVPKLRYLECLAQLPVSCISGFPVVSLGT